MIFTHFRLNRFHFTVITSLIGLVLGTIGLPLTGCAPIAHDDDQSQATYDLEIPLFTNDQYEFKKVQISTLNNISSVSGQAAEFYYNPTVKNNVLDGTFPQAKIYKSNQGSLVAEDLKSLELLTLYYHFEKLMFFDQKMGVFYVNSWPRKIGLEARVLDKNNRPSKNNARYASAFDGYLFESFIRPDLNLTVNGGVIAHEHFHSLFNKLVLIPLSQKFNSELPKSPEDPSHSDRAANDSNTRQLVKSKSYEEIKNKKIQVTPYLETIVRGWNEGLADTWGWIYTGDTKFVERSLSFEKSRDLSLNTQIIPEMNSLSFFMNSSVQSNSERLSYSYKLGSLHARMFYKIYLHKKKLSSAPDIEIRQEIAKLIVELLPQMVNSLFLLEEPVVSAALPIALLSQRSDLKDFCPDLVALVAKPDQIALNLSCETPSAQKNLSKTKLDKAELDTLKSNKSKSDNVNSQINADQKTSYE